MLSIKPGFTGNNSHPYSSEAAANRHQIQNYRKQIKQKEKWPSIGDDDQILASVYQFFLFFRCTRQYAMKCQENYFLKKKKSFIS